MTIRDLYQLYDTTNARPVGEPLMTYSNAVFLKQEFYEDRDDVVILKYGELPSDSADTVSKEDRES